MDDFEKKDLQSPENEADGFENRPDEDAKSPTQVEDDLVKELEGIRDLLQNELDSENTEAVTVKAAQTVGEDGELIQELDEIVETGDDEDGEKRKSASANAAEKMSAMTQWARIILTAPSAGSS